MYGEPNTVQFNIYTLNLRDLQFINLRATGCGDLSTVEAILRAKEGAIAQQQPCTFDGKAIRIGGCS